jgi:transcriptional regulator with XRE-family HTH domain
MDWVVGFRPRELARLRAARGLTLDAVARAVGVSDRSRVAQWESGAENPQPSALVALAAVLEVHPLELLEGGRAVPTLATLRSAAGLTRGQAATRVGMSRSAYRRLDAGQGRRDITPSLAAALAGAFGVDERTVLSAHQRSRAAGEDASENTDQPMTLAQLRRPHTAATVATALGITERSWYRLEAGGGRPELPAAWVDTLAALFDAPAEQVRQAHHTSRRGSVPGGRR